MLPLVGFAGLSAAGLAYKVRGRPTDNAEARRKVWKTLPGVTVPDGIQVKESEFVTSKGIKLAVTEFVPKTGLSKGVICVCHGYADQIDWLWYPRCLKLAKEGFTVIGLDHEGHGRSDGMLVYIPSFHRLMEGAYEVFSSFRGVYKNQKWILAGESMGGAVALWMLLHFGQEQWNALWLMCPMCKISPELTPPQPVVKVLVALAKIFPTWPIVPSENIVDKAFKDPKYVALVKGSPFYVDYEPRIGTATQLLEATQFIDRNMERITLPYLIVQGDKDVVTEPKTVEEFHRRSQSKDKTLKVLPGVWHGIYEDPEGGEEAWQDTLKWLNERC